MRNKLPPRTVLGATLALGIGLLALGCGSREPVVKVRGKLTKGGQPYQAKLTGANLPPGENVGVAEVFFYPVKADNELIVNESGELKAVGGHNASVNADGTFEVVGPKGKGIPPGKYRIVIKHIDPNTDADLLKGAFDERNSGVTRDVTTDAEVIIDLTKKTG
jgi:hypothetical protein